MGQGRTGVAGGDLGFGLEPLRKTFFESLFEHVQNNKLSNCLARTIPKCAILINMTCTVSYRLAAGRVVAINMPRLRVLVPGECPADWARSTKHPLESNNPAEFHHHDQGGPPSTGMHQVLGVIPPSRL